MKRSIIISMIFSCLCVTLTAQEGKVKRDAKDYLPKAGDFAISVSAAPTLYYLGNLFNNTTNNSMYLFGAEGYEFGSYTPDVSIAGKYMLTNRLGVRLNAGWIHQAYTRNYYTLNDAAVAANPLSRDKLIDSHKYNESGGSFSVAAEYRIGKRRIQAIMGGGLIYAFSSENHKYSYGNAVTELNQTPSTGLNSQDITPSALPDGFNYVRYLEEPGKGQSFGLIAFLGVEWFMAPKISISGEVNVVAAWNWDAPTYYTAEGFNTLSGAVEVWTELLTPRSSDFAFGTGNVGANLSVTFYF